MTTTAMSTTTEYTCDDICWKEFQECCGTPCDLDCIDECVHSECKENWDECRHACNNNLSPIFWRSRFAGESKDTATNGDSSR